MGLVESLILMETKGDDATLGAVWVVVTVAFDYQAGHSWDGAGSIEFALEAMILVSVDHSVGVVIKEALLLFLMASYPSVLI